MSTSPGSRLRIAAISFLNTAPLMWDFQHPPASLRLAERYRIDWMLPSECAARLADGTADLGLIPIAALAATPGLRILPGCTIASKSSVRSLLLVRRARQPVAALRSVAADTASRTTIAHARILFAKWGNPGVPFTPMSANLDAMLAAADAAIVIGDPALLALEESAARFARTGEQLVYHDLAQEWRWLTGHPFVSAVWAIASSSPVDESAAIGAVSQDCLASRDHGLRNIEAITAEWGPRLPLSAEIIRTYLTENIHYVLDDECLAAMNYFFREAAALGVLPPYDFATENLLA